MWDFYAYCEILHFLPIVKTVLHSKVMIDKIRFLW